MRAFFGNLRQVERDAWRCENDRELHSTRRPYRLRDRDLHDLLRPFSRRGMTPRVLRGRNLGDTCGVWFRIGAGCGLLDFIRSKGLFERRSRIWFAILDVHHQETGAKLEGISVAFTCEFDIHPPAVGRNPHIGDPITRDLLENCTCVHLCVAAIEPDFISATDAAHRPGNRLAEGKGEAREIRVLSGPDRYGFGSDHGWKQQQHDGEPAHQAASCFTTFSASSNSPKLGRLWPGVFWRPTSMQILVAWL